MLRRHTASAAAAIGLVSICVGAVGAQQPAKAGWSAPKTAWGDPDLTGIWPSTDMVGVPFERPESHFFTPLQNSSQRLKEESIQDRGQQKDEDDGRNGLDKKVSELSEGLCHWDCSG